MVNLRRREKLCLCILIRKTAILLVWDCDFNVWKARSFQNIGALKQNSSPLQEFLSFSFPLLGGARRCLSAGRRLEQWSEKQGQVMGFSGRRWPLNVDTQINSWSFRLLGHCLYSTRRQWWKQWNKIRKLIFCQHKELFFLLKLIFNPQIRGQIFSSPSVNGSKQKFLPGVWW